MEVRISFTVAEHGRDPGNGERFMDAFMATFPQGGPSVSQNFQDGTLTVTFALDADDARDAVEKAVRIFGAGAAATQLPASDVVDVEASVVEADTGEHSNLDPVPA